MSLFCQLLKKYLNTCLHIDLSIDRITFLKLLQSSWFMNKVFLVSIFIHKYNNNPLKLCWKLITKLLFAVISSLFCLNLLVSKIVRVIRQPRGNMLLIGIGGSGRQSLTRLGAYLCEYMTFQIEVTKHYRKHEFREGESYIILWCKRTYKS